MINAHSTHAMTHTSAVRDWLTVSRRLEILHVFDRVCNLTNEHQCVFSIVTPQIGNGPFHLVIREEIEFPKYLDADSRVFISDQQICLGALTINISGSEHWNTRPDWESLHANRKDISSRLAQLNTLHSWSRFAVNRLPGTALDPSLGFALSEAVVTANIFSVGARTRKLAGLGPGLTPAGDDFLVGSIYASWILHDPQIAAILGMEIANHASPLTTTLSAAWLQSAGHGEAGVRWHQLLDALLADNQERIRAGIVRLLAVGETSGADALAGFLSTFKYWSSLNRT